MKINYNTVEDLLELLSGLINGPKITIDSSDVTILHSIARQVFRGTPLTDRQYSLVKEKLHKYKDQFIDCNFDLAIETLRMPLREIDRRKYVKIVSHAEMVGPTNVYESHKEKWQWIKVRFPFSKKLITALQTISLRDGYEHKKGTHIHYFRLTETTAFQVVEVFKNKDFEIDQSLLDMHGVLLEMKNNKQNYIPGVYNLKLKNLSQRAINFLISDIGQPSIDNLSIYRDRGIKYGLHHFDDQDLQSSMKTMSILSQKIVTRKHRDVLVNKQKHTFNNLAESTLELNRFPLLVILPENNPLDDLVQVHRSFRGFIEDFECTVMFRLDNNSDSSFNEYIKNNNLNSKLDKNTKVVYINNNKLPKPLINSDWLCSTALLTESHRLHQKLSTFIEGYDLVMHYDTNASHFVRHKIEEI